MIAQTVSSSGQGMPADDMVVGAPNSSISEKSSAFVDINSRIGFHPLRRGDPA
jgi:hypothetical protein